MDTIKFKVYKNFNGQPFTHYIDVKQGAVIHVLVNDDGTVKQIYDDRYKGRLNQALAGKTLDDVSKFLKENKFIGTQIKPF